MSASGRRKVCRSGGPSADVRGGAGATRVPSRLRRLTTLIVLILLGACSPASDADRAAQRERGAAVGRDGPPGDGRDAAADSAFADSVLRAAEDLGATVTERASGLSAPVRDSVAIRLALEAYGPGTYFDEILAARDSVNYRWPERTRTPLRVWIQRTNAKAATRGFARAVRDAFEPWTETGIPIAFDFTEDSARAEIRVTWVDRYESRTTGRTRWVHDQHGWIIEASIELALAQPDGTTLDDESVHAIALHEVGHLLGVDHTADGANVMAPEVRVSQLSEADRGTVRLVYKLPPGSLRPR